MFFCLKGGYAGFKHTGLRFEHLDLRLEGGDFVVEARFGGHYVVTVAFAFPKGDVVVVGVFAVFHSFEFFR